MGIIMENIVNWKALQKLTQFSASQKSVGGNMWDTDAVSKMYNKMSALEKHYTLNQINALPLLPTDDVLDFGCGPGRITVPVAMRVHSVTAADSARLMLKLCKQNADSAHLKNVTPLYLDFDNAVPEKDVGKHDVVICSRSAGLSDLEKLSSFSKRIVAINIWANAPSIPDLLGKLFAGTHDGSLFPVRKSDRRFGYNLFFNIVYDLGYEPNIHIVEDGFTCCYATKEDAYADLISLGEVDIDKTAIFQRNVDQFLTRNLDGGYTFLMETRSCISWWDVTAKIY